MFCCCLALFVDYWGWGKNFDMDRYSKMAFQVSFPISGESCHVEQMFVIDLDGFLQSCGGKIVFQFRSVDSNILSHSLLSFTVVACSVQNVSSG